MCKRFSHRSISNANISFLLSMNLLFVYKKGRKIVKHFISIKAQPLLQYFYLFVFIQMPNYIKVHAVNASKDVSCYQGQNIVFFGYVWKNML